MKRKETTKNSTKKRLFFSFFKKHKALSVCLIIGAASVASFLVVNYGRYVKEIVETYYLRTKNFYFNSDKLTTTDQTYAISPWGGTTDYELHINMNSLLNSLKGTDSQIVYDVSCTCDNTVTCKFSNGNSSERRYINPGSHEDNFNVVVTPKTTSVFDTGDEIEVNVVAESVSPYHEVLSARFVLKVGNYGVGYTIEDQMGRLYLDVLVTNTKDTDPALVTLDIPDLTKVNIDESNDILNNITNSWNGTINGEMDYQVPPQSHNNSYMKKIEFYVQPKSSVLVRYYKRNPNVKYSTMDNVVTFSCLNCDD